MSINPESPEYIKQLFADYKKFLDAAPTPEDRQLRKKELHSIMYGAGPTKFAELRTLLVLPKSKE